MSNCHCEESNRKMAYAALEFKEKFNDSICFDGSTVQTTKNVDRICNKPFPNETRFGLIEKYYTLP